MSILLSSTEYRRHSLTKFIIWVILTINLQYISFYISNILIWNQFWLLPLNTVIAPVVN